jgi:3-oxoadipate enol-lactonase
VTQAAELKLSSSPRLFVTDRGAGEPVILITGWTISSAVFDPVAELYLRHVRVVAYDHRGAGRSAPWLAPVSMAMLAADAARVLDDRGITSGHVVGLSMGAAVALELAIRMPQRVKSLVLIGGGAGGPATVRPSARAVGTTVGTVLSDSLQHRHVWPAAALFSARFCDEQADVVAGYMPSFARHRAAPWMTGWQLLAVACFGRRGSLARVLAPTLVLHGGRDAMVPVANARLLADGIPGAELHVVPDAGHAVPLEHPLESARLLVEWVTRHAGAEPVAARKVDVIGERLTRPFSLPAGTWRNTRDAAVRLARASRPGSTTAPSPDDRLGVADDHT